MKLVKWLYPGLRVKRWLVLCFLGVMLIGAGLSVMNDGTALGFLEEKFKELSYYIYGKSLAFYSGGLVLLLGFVLSVVGFRSLINSMLEVLIPEKEDKLVEILYRKRHLKKGPKIVVIGGGTGLSVLLRGLKKYTSNITAIVTVADDGGSSGRLRGELGILPPGDIRNCLVALADKESLMEDLFNYRFGQGTGLVGHSLGNFLLAAMSDIVGDFEKAIEEMSKVLAIRGRVLPATLRDVILCAELVNGQVIEGESNISQSKARIKRVFLKPAACRPVPEALTAIHEADAVILGPGSLYTSVIPNLLVDGICQALQETPAAKIYICNVMTQPGETDQYSVADHLQALFSHCGPGVVNHVIVNVEGIPRSLLHRYQEQGAQPVKLDGAAVNKLNVRLVKENLIDETDFIRHHPEKLAKAIMKLVLQLKNAPEGFNFLGLNVIREKMKMFN